MSACEIQCFYHKSGEKCWTLAWVFQIQATETASFAEHIWKILPVVILTEQMEQKGMKWETVRDHGL